MFESDFAQTETLLNQVHQPILQLKDTTIVFKNKAAQEIFGLTSGQLADYMPAHDLAAYQAMSPGQQASISLEIEGEIWDGAVTRNQEDAILFLSQKDREKDLLLQLLPSLGGAIRNPVSQIFNALDDLLPLLEEQENPTYQALTSQVNQGMYRLLRLSANMFDYALYVGGNRPINIEKIDMITYFESKFIELESLCTACGITLHTNLTAKNLIGYFDGQQIYRLILNLISNGVAASKQGGFIKLDVTARGQMLKIQVEDKGVGMTPAVLGRLFHQFENGELHKKTGSSAGFGLPMAREIAMAHGGTIMVNSAPNQGTVVVATARIAKELDGVNTEKTTMDYTGGLNICALEMAEVLPNSEFDSRSI